MELYSQVEKYNKKRRCKESFISDNDMNFICGLLRDTRPKKILELGVAKGGSTVDILNCINELNLECEMFSVDMAKNYFLDENLQTGYVAEEYKRKTGKFSFHKMLLGKSIVECIEEIGTGIDFVFMDTIHKVPGEIMDFLVLYPYLAKNAIVVLDDLKVHYYQEKSDIACTVLFQTVTADKFLNLNDLYPNVGAYRITNDTSKYLLDVFNALLLPWEYIPDRMLLAMYDAFFSKWYSVPELRVWQYAKDMAIYFDEVKNNKICVCSTNEEEVMKICHNKKILIYGAGKRAAALLKFLSHANVEVLGFVVSEGHKSAENYEGFSVYEYSSIGMLKENFLIIQAVLSEAVSIRLVASGYNYLILSESLWEKIEFNKC